MQSPDKIDLSAKLALFTDHWSPKIVAELNGQHVKVVKLQGEFTWHHHEQEDELFLVLRGKLRMQFLDREVALGPGELIVVPRGTVTLSPGPSSIRLPLCSTTRRPRTMSVISSNCGVCGGSVQPGGATMWAMLTSSRPSEAKPQCSSMILPPATGIRLGSFFRMLMAPH